MNHKKLFISIATSVIAASLYAETFTLNDFNDINWSFEPIWDISGETTQTFPQNGGDVIMHNSNYTPNARRTLKIDGDYKIDSLDLAMRGKDKEYILRLTGKNTLEIANDSVINAALGWF